jgi:hypothetical protein
MSATTRTVLKQNEVLLYGTNFPIVGTVRRTAVTPFAPKFTIGDSTRDDNIVVSSWILRGFSGGIGIKNGALPRDNDRFWDASLSTPYRDLVLNMHSYLIAGLPASPDFMIEYNGDVYAAVGESIYRSVGGGATFTSLHGISGVVNGGCIFNGRVYFITDNGLFAYDAVGDDWYDYVSPDTYIPSGDDIIVWDGKLFRIGVDTTTSSLTRMYWTDDPDPNNDGVSTVADWELGGILHLARKDCRQLLIYFDLTGEPVVHAITKSGVYGYEFDSGKFYETPVSYPHTSNAGRGAIVWRGELYVPAGQTVYKYNGSTIQVVSPNKDDGLPPYLRGDIIQLVAGHGFYYAVVSSSVQGDDESVGMEFFDDTTPDDTVLLEEFPVIGSYPLGSVETVGTVLMSTGTAWHTIFTTNVANIGYSLVASAGDNFRLWIGSELGVHYINLDTGLHNPLQNPNTEYTDTGYLETPWVDMGWVELDKLALSLSLDADGINAVLGTGITVEVAWDGNEVWEELVTITENGVTTIRIGGEDGFVFKSVKLRISMYRGPDVITATPIMKSLVFGFMRRPNLLWGWEINIILTKPLHYGMSAEDLIERLYQMSETTRTAGRFIYRDRRSGTLNSKRAVISNISGAETTGSNAVGRYTVSLLQIDDPGGSNG